MSFAGKQSEEAEEQRVALAITESIAVWLKEIKNKFKGRFPDDVRAAYRAVHQAAGFAANATEHSASAAAQGRALDTNPTLIIEERRCWHAWFAGDGDDLVAMHIAKCGQINTPRSGQISLLRTAGAKRTNL